MRIINLIFFKFLKNITEFNEQDNCRVFTKYYRI